MQSSVLDEGNPAYIPGPSMLGMYNQLSRKSQQFIDKTIRSLASQEAAQGGRPSPAYSAPVLRLLPGGLA